MAEALGTAAPSRPRALTIRKLTAPPPSDPGLRIAFEEALAGYHEGDRRCALFYRGELLARHRRVQDGNPILHAETTCFLQCRAIARPGLSRRSCIPPYRPGYMRSGASLLFGALTFVIGESRTRIHAADDWPCLRHRS